MRPGRIQSILFLQKAEVLPLQEALVIEAISRELPGARVTACGSFEGVPEGAGFDAVIAPTLPWLPQALSRLERYHWIHFLSAGVEKIWDMPFPKDGVLLTKSSGVHGSSMGEFALGAMLHFAKSFDQFVEQSRQRVWKRVWLDELDGRTVTILGMGHIGGAIAQRAKAFGMKVVGVQRTPRETPGVDAMVGIGQLAEVLPHTQYLVVCLPLTADTEGMVDDALLAKLPAGAVLVDISRGGVVRESAVVDALTRGHLRGAALDVFEQEPLSPESALWDNPQVLLTPHVSGTNPRYMEKAMEVFIANAKQLIAGKPAVTPVDTERRY